MFFFGLNGRTSLKVLYATEARRRYGDTHLYPVFRVVTRTTFATGNGRVIILAGSSSSSRSVPGLLAHLGPQPPSQKRKFFLPPPPRLSSHAAPAASRSRDAPERRRYLLTADFSFPRLSHIPTSCFCPIGGRHTQRSGRIPGKAFRSRPSAKSLGPRVAEHLATQNFPPG